LAVFLIFFPYKGFSFRENCLNLMSAQWQVENGIKDSTAPFA
jgi:hypothetical protein